jgi:hypothetical protein
MAGPRDWAARAMMLRQQYGGSAPMRQGIMGGGAMGPRPPGFGNGPPPSIPPMSGMPMPQGAGGQGSAASLPPGVGAPGAMPPRPPGFGNGPPPGAPPMGALAAPGPMASLPGGMLGNMPPPPPSVPGGAAGGAKGNAGGMPPPPV